MRRLLAPCSGGVLLVCALLVLAGCRAARTRPDPPDAARARAVERYNLGLGLREEGRLEPALAAFREAREIVPPEVDFQVAEIDVLLRLGYDEGALERARVAEERVDDPVPVRRLRAEAALRAGAPEEALVAARTLREERPDDLEARILHGRALAATGATEEAARVLARARDLAGSDQASPFAWSAAMALASGRPVEARGFAREAISRDPRSAAGYAALARASWELGERQRAVEALRRYLAVSPPGEAASPRGRRMHGLRVEMERASLSP